MRDAMPSRLSVDGAILEHPRFEWVEMGRERATAAPAAASRTLLAQTNFRFVLDSGGHSSRSIGESLARWWFAFAVVWSSHAVHLAAWVTARARRPDAAVPATPPNHR